MPLVCVLMMILGLPRWSLMIWVGVATFDVEFQASIGGARLIRAPPFYPIKRK